MKIEIDLDDIFRNEDGSPDESLEESIRRQVIERLSGDLRKRLFARMDIEVSKIMQTEIGKVMQEKMPDMIDDIMNATYTPVNSYGSRGEPTTFRDEIIKSISANLKYDPGQYGHGNNAFTKAVMSIVESKTDAIKKAITDQVDVKFKEDAIKFAVARLSERLGLQPAGRG